MTKEEVKEFMDEFKKTQFDDLHVSDSRLRVELQLPLESTAADAYKYKIKYPLNYHEKKCYKVFCDNGWIFKLYRKGKSIYIFEYNRTEVITQREVESFKTTLLYSFSLYLIYSLVTKYKFKKIHSTVMSDIFTPFEDEDSDIELYVDMFDRSDKINLNRNLYVSIFN